MQQRVHRLISDDPDITAATAIAARRTAAGHKFFTSKRRHAVTAVAAPNLNFCSIDEHVPLKPSLDRRHLGGGARASCPQVTGKDAGEPHAGCVRSYNQKCDPAETTSAQ